MERLSLCSGSGQKRDMFIRILRKSSDEMMKSQQAFAIDLTALAFFNAMPKKLSLLPLRENCYAQIVQNPGFKTD